MLNLLFEFDMVVDRCGRCPMLEVRGTEEDEGCRLEDEAEGSRMGKLVLLSDMVVSWAPRESGGGTSPRLDTRLSSERVRVDLERLCWLAPLLLLLVGGESVVVDWTEAYEGCRCRCGLGDKRDVICMEMCRVVVVARGGVAKKRGVDRVSRRKASPSWPAPLVRLLAGSRARLYKGGGGCVLCCQGAV